MKNATHTTDTTAATTGDRHPAWCNVQHRPDADPRRQSHNHWWHGTDGGGRRWRAELYPPSTRDDDTTVSIRFHGPGGEFFWMWPTAADARALGESLFQLSEVALRGEA